MTRFNAQGGGPGVSNLPVATILIAAITAAVTLVQFADPSLLYLLRRNPQALAAGQWWRVASSLLVHDGGWLQFIPNVAGIMLVGATLEPEIGSWRIGALYLAGGLSGIAAGYAWDPLGAGASVGLCGLMAGLALRAFRRPTVKLMPPLVFSVFMVGGLSVMATGGSWASIVILALLGLLLSALVRQAATQSLAMRCAAGVSLAQAVLMVLLRDHHGVALLAGFGCALAVTLPSREC